MVNKKTVKVMHRALLLVIEPYYDGKYLAACRAFFFVGASNVTAMPLQFIHLVYLVFIFISYECIMFNNSID